MAAPGPASLTRSLRWFAASYGIALLGYLLLSAAVSRLVGADEFGTYLVIVTATTLIGQIGLLGVHRGGLREAARLSEDDVAGLAELRAGVRAVTSITLPAVSVLAAVATWFLMHQRDGQSQLWLALLTGALVYLAGEQRLCANYLRGLGHVRLAGLLEGRSGGALVAAGQSVMVLLLLLLRPESGLVGALAATVLGFAAPIVVARVVLSRRWAHTDAIPGRWANLRRAARRDWRFVASQVGGFANSSIELWLAAILLSPFATSMFGAGQRLAHLLLIPQTSLAVVFSPTVARMSVDDDRLPLQTLLRTGSTLTTSAAVLLWLPMMVAPSLLLVLVFGVDFSAAAAVLMLLASGYLLNVATGLAAVTLSMSHHEGQVAIVHWLALGLRVVLGVTGALLWGLLGLAISSMTVTIATSAMMWLQARRRVGVSTHPTLRPRVRLLSQARG